MKAQKIGDCNMIAMNFRLPSENFCLSSVFEVASCFGLGFSYDGVKIFCGYRNMIKIFDIDVPGTTCQTINAKSTPYFHPRLTVLKGFKTFFSHLGTSGHKISTNTIVAELRYSNLPMFLVSELNEQTGYVSCIAQNPTMHSLIAAGSFSRTIGLLAFFYFPLH